MIVPLIKINLITCGFWRKNIIFGEYTLMIFREGRGIPQALLLPTHPGIIFKKNKKSPFETKLTLFLSKNSKGRNTTIEEHANYFFIFFGIWYMRNMFWCVFWGSGSGGRISWDRNCFFSWDRIHEVEFFPIFHEVEIPNNWFDLLITPFSWDWN